MTATRTELVAEAGRRLGDSSAAFVSEIDLCFDWVLRDLAGAEAISDLKRTATFAIIASQTDYDTQTITGLASPYYPLRIEQIRVGAWGLAGLIPRLSDTDFDLIRASFDTTEGRFAGWRVYPNEQTLQVVPAASGVEALDTAEVTYVAPPAVIAAGDELTEVRTEFAETVIFGMMARMAPFKEDYAAEGQLWWQLYVAGRSRMRGQRFNSRGGRIEVSPF